MLCARYCTSSALAYFFSHFNRTGRSMPMPLIGLYAAERFHQEGLRVGRRR